MVKPLRNKLQQIQFALQQADTSREREFVTFTGENIAQPAREWPILTACDEEGKVIPTEQYQVKTEKDIGLILRPVNAEGSLEDRYQVFSWDSDANQWKAPLDYDTNGLRQLYITSSRKTEEEWEAAQKQWAPLTGVRDLLVKRYPELAPLEKGIYPISEKKGHLIGKTPLPTEQLISKNMCEALDKLRNAYYMPRAEVEIFLQTQLSFPSENTQEKVQQLATQLVNFGKKELELKLKSHLALFPDFIPILQNHAIGLKAFDDLKLDLHDLLEKNDDIQKEALIAFCKNHTTLEIPDESNPPPVIADLNSVLSQKKTTLRTEIKDAYRNFRRECLGDEETYLKKITSTGLADFKDTDIELCSLEELHALKQDIKLLENLKTTSGNSFKDVAVLLSDLHKATQPRARTHDPETTMHVHFLRLPPKNQAVLHQQIASLREHLQTLFLTVPQYMSESLLQGHLEYLYTQANKVQKILGTDEVNKKEISQIELDKDKLLLVYFKRELGAFLAKHAGNSTYFDIVAIIQHDTNPTLTEHLGETGVLHAAVTSDVIHRINTKILSFDSRVQYIEEHYLQQNLNTFSAQQYARYMDALRKALIESQEVVQRILEAIATTQHLINLYESKALRRTENFRTNLAQLNTLYQSVVEKQQKMARALSFSPEHIDQLTIKFHLSTEHPSPGSKRNYSVHDNLKEPRAIYLSNKEAAHTTIQQTETQASGSDTKTVTTIMRIASLNGKKSQELCANERLVNLIRNTGTDGVFEITCKDQKRVQLYALSLRAFLSELGVKNPEKHIFANRKINWKEKLNPENLSEIKTMIEKEFGLTFPSPEKQHPQDSLTLSRTRMGRTLSGG